MSYFFTAEEEMDYRRILLRLAAQGNARAIETLEREYHVRVYSTTQRARYIPKVERSCLSAAVQRKVDALLYAQNFL